MGMNDDDPSISDIGTMGTRLQEEINADDYNPFHDLDHLHKIKVDYDLSSSTTTPFDLSRYF
jgi:hypothetical protein